MHRRVPTRYRRISRAPAAILAAGMLVATACTGTGPPEGSVAPGASATPTETPQQGGRIVEGSTTDLVTAQPVLSNDATSSRVAGLLYDSLIVQDPKTGEPRPNMATWTVSSDGLTYSFAISEKANWSDGRPVIAQDMLTGITAVARSAKSVRKPTFQDIVGFNELKDGKATSISGFTIDRADAKRFTIRLAKVSCPAILQIVGGVAGPLPTHVFGRYLTATSRPEDFDAAPENIAPTVFSGPFKLKEWRRGDQVILARNESYWRGAPNVDEFVVKIVPSIAAITAGLKSGEITFGGIRAQDLAEMRTVQRVRITKYQGLGYDFIAWHTRSPSVSAALGDKRVRQAFAYGIDMDAIIKAVVFGEATRQVAHHVPVEWAYPTNPLELYRYDRSRAESLLRDAGWVRGADGILGKEGKKLAITISTNALNRERERFAQMAADDLKALGVDARARPEEFEHLTAKLTTGDQTLEATIIGWGLGGDPDPYSIWHSSQIPDPAKGVTGLGFTGFASPELDKAIEEGRNPTSGNCSTAARKKHYETFNKILNENQPYDFGYASNVLTVSQRSLQNFAPGSFSILHNVHQWWIRR